MEQLLLEHRFPDTVHDAARWYAQRNFVPVPVGNGKKRPTINNWQKLQIDLQALEKHFPPNLPQNISLLLGSPSQGLIDIDLDCDEAVRGASHFLPQTGWVSGRDFPASFTLVVSSR